MTMPGKKSVNVNGVDYRYVIKPGPRGLIGETSGAMSVTIQLGPGKFMRKLVVSKLWTEDHSENPDVTPVHKNSLTPKDIAAMVRAALPDGVLPEGFDLPQWKVVEIR